MKTKIYADHAATTELCPTAFEAMKPWLTTKYGNASTLYSLAHESRKAIRSARETIASLIGASPEEIYFTSGGTEADNWAIKSSAFADEEKRATITSAFEHHAVLHSCQAIERLGYPVAYLWPTQDGYVTPDTLCSCITKQTRLVSVMLVNNELGTVQNIHELARIAHENGAIFHTDAVQGMGHLSINVNELSIDMMSASAHKFNGPKGIGFLYIRKGTSIIPLLDGGRQEHQLRAGTENVAAIVGMSEALRENCSELAANASYLKELETVFLEKMEDASIEFRRNGGENRLPGLLSISFPESDGEVLLHRLDLSYGICVSTGSACNSESAEISHVLQAICLDERYAKGTIRISFGKENTVEEAVKIADAIIEILK